MTAFLERVALKIAVVTPVYQTPRDWLEQCLHSVARQSMRCTHFLVSDGDPELNAAAFPGVAFLRLPGPHADVGNAARAIGSVCAIAQGYDAIAYLDADNWFAPDHLQQLADLHRQTGAAICSSSRDLVDLDGQPMGRCQEVDGEQFVDTSCLFLTHAAFGIVSVWYRMPRPLVAIGDRVVWKAIRDQKLTRAHRAIPTVRFRTRYRSHYEHFGRTPPPGAKSIEVVQSAAGEFLSAREMGAKSCPLPGAARVAGNRSARVSLCMIVKNEEDHLADCLAPVAKLFEEIIVVDTGSTDRTKEVAIRHGAKVYDFAWVDSFAAARNESLRHATGDWIFWLDADDRLDEDNLQKLQKLLRELPEENNAYLMRQWSNPDPFSGSPFVVDQVRLFRNLPLARWSYRVHEQIFLALRSQGAKEVGTDIVIHHLGYQEAALRERKHERNLRLLKMESTENPSDAFVQYNLANVYLDRGQAEQALLHLQECIRAAPANVSFLSRAYFLSAASCLQLGRDEEALRHCRVGKERFPEAAELLFQEGVVLLARRNWAEARQCFESLLKRKPNRAYVGVDADMTGFRTRHNLAFAYRNLGLLREAEEQWRVAVEQWPHFGPAWMALLELFLEQKRESAIESLLERLKDKPYVDTIRPALQARRILGRQGFAATRQILEEGIVRAPKAIWLRHTLVEMLLQVAKDERAAETHLRAILAVAPHDPHARLKLAQLLQEPRKG